jgi:chromate transporter
MTAPGVPSAECGSRPGSALEVLQAFGRLGMISFGGPIAHIGYFRQEFVVHRRWLDEPTYADLVALCQFLPGPASSQVGFSIGLMRAGYLGGLAAWSAFTLPSAAFMVLFAYGAAHLQGSAWPGLLHGLQLAAVAIVAQAVWGMAHTLCPDRTRVCIALAAAVLTLVIVSPAGQIGAIALGGLAGWRFCRGGPSRGGPSRSDPAPAVASPTIPVSHRAGTISLVLFSILLVGLPLLHACVTSLVIAHVDAFYRSGALVFGGGHVVLPLLRDAVVRPGWVGEDAFLAGYGAAQSVPGPLFSFAAYLGAVIRPAHFGLAGAALGLAAIFLPGVLILLGTLPFWDSFRRRPGTQTVTRGINAAVVGLLGAALYALLWSNAMKTAGDFGVALAGFLLLTAWRTPPLLIVILSALGGMALA